MRAWKPVSILMALFCGVSNGFLILSVLLAGFKACIYFWCSVPVIVPVFFFFFNVDTDITYNIKVYEYGLSPSNSGVFKVRYKCKKFIAMKKKYLIRNTI